jgi:carbohydrate-selective porin OprB
LRNLLSPVIDLQDTHGVELYYTAAIAPMVFLTADLQAIEPANARNDTAVVFGLRASMGM